MCTQIRLANFFRLPSVLASIAILGLSACGSSDDESGVGYVQLYNASPNSPAIFLVVDKDDDDDFAQKTHSSVLYAQAGGYFEYDAATYDIDLSWNDGSSDLDVINESQVTVSTDVSHLIVIADDIAASEVLTFDIPIIDDDADDDNDLFNLRLINMHNYSGGVDVYLSKANETFNEAVLFGQLAYKEMAENTKYDQDDYVFYLTASGSSEVLYQSEEIAFVYPSQYLLIIRANSGPGDSPFTLDYIAKSTGATEFQDADSSAEFRVYNGLTEHYLLPKYANIFNLYINGIDETAEIASLSFGEFSQRISKDFGDYSLDLTIPETGEVIVKNHLMTLNSGSDKTVFFYTKEEDISEDDDEEELEITLNSLVVNNSNRDSFYDHQVNIINLIDDFTKVAVYFVESNETIDSTGNDKQVPYVTPQSITLLNNTYSVYVVGEENSSEMILVSTELILDDESDDLFLILEEDVNSSTGYKLKFSKQAE